MASFRSDDTASQIKERLTAQEAFKFYGFPPNRAGFIRCPFHSGDKHGSLKIYSGAGGWHCFGCGAGGSVIDFAMRLFDVGFPQACDRLNTDFGLGLKGKKPTRAEQSALVEARRREAERKSANDAEYKRQAARYRYYRDAVENTDPQSDLFAEAVKALEPLEYWLDENLGR